MTRHEILTKFKNIKREKQELILEKCQNKLIEFYNDIQFYTDLENSLFIDEKELGIKIDENEYIAIRTKKVKAISSYNMTSNIINQFKEIMEG